jgi:hypothetical protein
VKTRTLSFAWYRFRTTLRQRGGGLLAVVLLTSLLGGLSMGAIAAARTTESSPADFATSTDTPDLFVLDGFYNPEIGLNSAYNPTLLRKIAHLPHVEKVESEVGINAGPVTKDGESLPASNGIGPNGSIDGLGFNEDRIIVTHGRLANPTKADEFVMDSATARLFGLHLGESVDIGWITNDTGISEGSSGAFKVPRDQRMRVTLVGVGAVDVDGLFQDQDSANSGTIVEFTPAFTRKLLACCSSDMESALTLEGGFNSPYYSSVEAELRGLLPQGVPFTHVEVRDVESRAERTLKPESIALGVFGGIAGLAALLICAQVMGRRIRLSAGDLDVVRALGAGPAMTVADGLIGSLAAVLIGSLLAGAIAIALSPVGPLGPIGPILPFAFRVDWTVVGAGVGALLVGLGTLALVLAYRGAPHRVAARLPREGGSGVTRVAAATGLPPAAVAGVRLALDPGVGRNSVPVRSAVLGAILAVVVVVSTITFGSSMGTLVSHPSLYGWNWTYEIDGGGGLGDVPGPPVEHQLSADPYVAGWAGVYFSTLDIDGIDVPVMGGNPGAPVGPTPLSGHGFTSGNEVVLGAATLAELHKHLGETVQVGGAGSARTTLTIVGTATMPSIGVAGSSHLEMGTGALLSYKLISPGARNVFDESVAGPNAILVRLKPGANAAAGRASLETIVRRNPQIAGGGGSLMGVERPAEILNYSTLGKTPALLGAALAAGAVVALGLTLITSVRRRRTDLALLKTLGFTKRQLAGAIAWQATIAVGIGCLVGIPLGIALGRYLWDLFARGINAVPDPVVPAPSILLIAVIALLLANLVAFIPGRIAARTPTAQLLRSE